MQPITLESLKAAKRRTIDVPITGFGSLQIIRPGALQQVQLAARGEEINAAETNDEKIRILLDVLRDLIADESLRTDEGLAVLAEHLSIDDLIHVFNSVSNQQDAVDAAKKN